MMDLNKEIQFSFEFVSRLIERGIISAFNNDLNKARIEIEHKIRHESVIIDSPSKHKGHNHCNSGHRPNVYRCL